MDQESLIKEPNIIDIVSYFFIFYLSNEYKQNNTVYKICILIGMGLLLPWNSVLSGFDFFSQKVIFIVAHFWLFYTNLVISLQPFFYIHTRPQLTKRIYANRCRQMGLQILPLTSNNIFIYHVHGFVMYITNFSCIYVARHGVCSRYYHCYTDGDYDGHFIGKCIWYDWYDAGKVYRCRNDGNGTLWSLDRHYSRYYTVNISECSGFLIK